VEEVEMDGLEANGTWRLVPRSQVPSGSTILRNRFVYADKKDKNGNVGGAKARLVAMGNTQVHGDSYFETFASVSNVVVIRMCLSILISNPKCSMYHYDIEQAFTEAPLEETVYMLQPKGREKEGYERFVYLLIKALYGTKQAARAFQKHLRNILGKIGLRPLDSDNGTYYKSVGEEWIIIPTHVDDLFPLSNS